MTIQDEVRGDVLVLRLAGRFAAGVDEEYQRAKNEIQRSGCRKVLLDCSQIPCAGSSGLSFFVGLYHTVRRARGFLVLAGANKRIREVLRLTMLDRVFWLFPHEAAALAAFAEWEAMVNWVPAA
ncbi:MAG TPA: STAS domain-containing protein [Bryobacteraceae bacterium]|nr:STAS domain-containing protein [Bryobacteraceae bacterium]